MLNGKRITVGITGGIAAYKAVEIVNWLNKSGAKVQVAMTKAACSFVTPLTFKTLSGNPVLTDIMDESPYWHVPHIDIADCDLFIVLPATANIIAKAANGIADDLLSAALLATTAPILCAPAMNSNMYANAATQHNLAVLRQRGWHIIQPETGHLACGTVGKGHLAAEEDIKEDIQKLLAPADQPLKGKKILVTAGPTYEYIDPVRFIGNRSSGKMGFALAQAAANAGGNVVLISGPVGLPDPDGIRIIGVTSAREMRDAVIREYADTDIVIMAAAVADYRPKAALEKKIKKSDEQLRLELVKNPDILKELGQDKGNRFLCGFAAETENLADYARDKLIKKNLDMIVANDVSRDDSGFDVDTNAVTVYYDEKEISFPLMSKQAVAGEIIRLIGKLLK